MQKDQEVAKQVIEKLKGCLCQQGQPKVVKQQSPTSNTSQLFLTLTALESAGSNSHTSPRSLLQLPLPLVDTARKPFPCCKQLYEVWQQSDINCKDFVVVVKILKMSRTKNPQTTWELKVVWALRGQRGGNGRATVCTAVRRPVAFRKSCIFCWRKASLPLSPSINGCAAPQGAPAGWLRLLPIARRNVQPLSSGSTHSKMDWNVFRIVSVWLEGQCRGEKVRKFRQMHKTRNVFLCLFVSLTPFSCQGELQTSVPPCPSLLAQAQSSSSCTISSAKLRFCPKGNTLLCKPQLLFSSPLLLHPPS